MSLRRLLNVSRPRQIELQTQFSWLVQLDQEDQPEHIKTLWVSVFDHWLSREDAIQLLENIPAQEALRRNRAVPSCSACP